MVHASAEGWRDVKERSPLKRDTLFRIASMTKPITSAVALMLLEEGRFALNQPITRWAPEFADLLVLSAPGTRPETTPAKRPITFDDLLTHRSGLTYGDFHPGILQTAYQEALGGSIDNALTPDEWIRRLASLPLVSQPGEEFHYGHSTDLLGFLISRMEDAPLSDVFQQRIFGPLGMVDTCFAVPKNKGSRRARPYGLDENGQLVERTLGPGGAFLPERPGGMSFVSGGQGLWSTLDDYLTFARMFLGGGTVEGVRLLRPQTLSLMVENVLTEKQRENAWWILGRGHGFGRGVAVVVDPSKAETRPCGGSLGSVGWPGAFGGWWRADAREQSIQIFLTHNMLELDQLMSGLGSRVEQALEEFQSFQAM